jgi:hypothetical protein
MSDTKCSHENTVIYIDHVFRLSSYFSTRAYWRSPHQTPKRFTVRSDSNLRKMTISCVMSDRLSAWNSSASLWNGFDQILYSRLLLKFHDTFQLWSKSLRKKDYLHEDRKTFITFYRLLANYKKMTKSDKGRRNARQSVLYRVIKKSLRTWRTIPTQLMSWRWPSQNTFRLWWPSSTHQLCGDCSSGAQRLFDYPV